MNSSLIFKVWIFYNFPSTSITSVKEVFEKHHYLADGFGDIDVVAKCLSDYQYNNSTKKKSEYTLCLFRITSKKVYPKTKK